MERVIIDQVQIFLQDNNLITHAQYGFQSGSSTVTQLIECHNEWVTSQNSGEATDVIYLDYAKAFDSVIHSNLLNNLYAYGIRDDLLKWFENFLSSRTQAVTINGVLSDFLPVTCGVIQGSGCSSQLFELYINDLPEIIPPTVKVYLFADDTKLTKIIRTIADCSVLQVALCSAASWSALWQLMLNIIKSIEQRLGRSNTKYNYHLSGLTLESCDHVKDLGITVSKDLSYHKHIKTTSAAAKRFYIAKSCFRSTSILVLRLILKAFIIPFLEYGSVIWNPHSYHEIDSLEEVQRRITALALGKHMSYVRRLEMFDLQSLQDRRSIVDLVTYHKILSNRTRINPASLFNMNTRLSRRTNSLSLTMPLCHTSAFLHSFHVRAISRWNCLPDSVMTTQRSFVFAKGAAMHLA